jgi:hypothetical protein
MTNTHGESYDALPMSRQVTGKSRTEKIEVRAQKTLRWLLDTYDFDKDAEDRILWGLGLLAARRR